MLIVLLITLVGFASEFHKTPINPSKLFVEVRCGGDDNLTQGVCRNIYNEFASTPDFVITDKHNTGSLIINVPTNVHWKERGKRTIVFYIVEFLSSYEKKLGKKKGECWEDNLKTCAVQVLKEARAVARNKKH